MKPSLRSIMVAISTLLIFLTALATLLITYNFSLMAAKKISEKHAMALGSKAQSDVENFLKKPLGRISGWQYALTQNDHPLPSELEKRGEMDWYEPEWEEFVQSMRSVDFKYQYAVTGFNDGNYAGCKLVSAGFMCRVFSWRTRAATGKSWVHQKTYNISDHGLIADELTTTSYDPRTRVWYKMVDHEPWAMEWSPVYLSAMPTLPIVDVQASLFNKSGTFIGVTSLTFELGQLSGFLDGLETTPNTKAVLLDNDDLLLASSYPIPFLTKQNISKNFAGDIPGNCLVSDSSNDATSSILLCRSNISSYDWTALRELATKFPSVISNGVEGAIRTKLDGNTYYVVVAAMKTEMAKGMNWRFVLLMPENDIIGDIVSGRNIAIGIVSALVVIGGIISGFSVTVLLSPLARVAERMYQTATLQDSDEDDTPSLLQEVSTIQVAYETMKNELAKLKSFLPQSVLVSLYPDANNDDDDDEGEGDIIFDDKTSQGTAVSSHHPNTTSGVSKDPKATLFKRQQKKGADDRSSRASSSVKVTPSEHNSKYEKGAAGAATVAVAATSFNTALKLVNRKVTVLCVNMGNFNQMTKNVLPDELLRLHGNLVSSINKIAAANKGVLDSFHGDHR